MSGRITQYARRAEPARLLGIETEDVPPRSPRYNIARCR
jgi:hypothetical protein